MSSRVNRTERGWAENYAFVLHGHYSYISGCRFRRNTLLEYGGIRVVVSTMGAWWDDRDGICSFSGKYYETKVFEAEKIGPFWYANVLKDIGFESKGAICAKNSSSLPLDADNLANQMHEDVVTEIEERLLCGERFPNNEQKEKRK